MDQNRFRRRSSSGYSSNSRNTSKNSGNSSFSMDTSETAPEESNDASNLSVVNLSTTDNRNQSGSGRSMLDLESKSKLANIPKYKAKLAVAKPFVGFEFDELKPIRRTMLDLDKRFFPTGLQPGSIIELRGDEGAGKTLLITYLLARVVVSSPIKTAVLIDTSLHFNNRVLINMISHFDRDIKFDKNDYSLEPVDIIKANPKLSSYLKRISTLKCLNAEQLLVTLGPGHDSTLENMLLSDPNLSLVAVDTIDNFSFISSFKDAAEDQQPNFLHLICHAVAATKTPVICAASYSSYHSKNPSADKSANNSLGSERFGPSLTSESTKSPRYNSETDTTAPTTTDEPAIQKPDWYSNVIIDYTLFTHSLYLQKLECSDSEKPVKYLRCAHLRSRHSPKTALFSVVNHRAKFSIFSDMLYVDG